MKKVFLLLLLILFPINIDAFNLGKSAILIEENTKRILVAKNINEKRLIASTTKIMTAIIPNEVNNIIFLPHSVSICLIAYLSFMS